MESDTYQMKPKQLSPEMKACLEHINGRTITRYPGGFWYPEGDGKPNYGTTTVRALVDRGELEWCEWKENRAGKFPIKAKVPQPDQAKQADEVLYGLEGQELLDNDIEAIVSHLLHDNCEQPGESFDVVADRIAWPVKVLEFRRMKVSDAEKNSLAASTLESVIESLDENHAGPDGASTKPTAPMQLAARLFIDEVTRNYVGWNCEPTGEVVEITREKAKEIVG